MNIYQFTTIQIQEQKDEFFLFLKQPNEQIQGVSYFVIGDPRQLTEKDFKDKYILGAAQTEKDNLKITIPKQNLDGMSILNFLQKGTKMEYTIFDNNVFIKRKGCL